jgi:hypothetical protein
VGFEQRVERGIEVADELAPDAPFERRVARFDTGRDPVDESATPARKVDLLAARVDR